MTAPQEDRSRGFLEFASHEEAVEACVDAFCQGLSTFSPNIPHHAPVRFEVMELVRHSDVAPPRPRIFIPRTRLGRWLVHLRGLRRRLLRRRLVRPGVVTIELSTRQRLVAQVTFDRREVVVHFLRDNKLWPDAGMSTRLSADYDRAISVLACA